MIRACACDHGFPLCACILGFTDAALVFESRRISSLAGWPARIEPGAAARVLAAELAKGRRAEGHIGGCGCGGRA
jgi:hypothetical protein